ncbi:DUF4172 domain-containing protein [Candidatus Venteria ishoeyi]|uniref:DUF4172 domain-containing protein n=1 Tax=Candidatus Venteria ishoeyi TaxID=1899563 RepID=A0A1H6FB95_9GAMM|nr:DUF4172 domain-containing protein [Candidatus Venteria ishoeyi]SEH07358.1 Uncharacterised protein [Candidatus Venteria ishoeyi]
MWIWQQTNWPDFSYQAALILPALENVVKSVAPLTLLATELDEKQRLTLESQVLLEEALATAKIEGEMLDRESVRSSIARQLGIGITQQASSKSAQAFVTVLLEAVRTATQTLTEKQLFQFLSK